MYKKLLILALFCNVVFSDWEVLSFPDSIIDELICTDSTIYAVSVIGEVYASYDEGETWEFIIAEHNDLLPYGFDTFAQTGNYLFISQNIVPPYYNYRANINNTSIGEWEPILYQDSAILEFISYENHIYALSWLNEGIRTSSDYGDTWQMINPPVDGYIQLLLVDAEYIYVAEGCNLYRASTATYDWENITGILDEIGPPDPYSCTLINDLEPIDDMIVISMYWYGGVGMLFVSEDKGNSWMEVTSFPAVYSSGYIYSISELLYKNGILYAGTATSQNGIFYTEDLLVWKEYSDGLSSFNLSVNKLFTTSLNVYKIGGTVNIYKNQLINPYHLGDINQDGIINVLDIVSIINMVLNGEFNIAADVNEDGFVDILDVVLMVTVIVGGLP